MPKQNYTAALDNLLKVYEKDRQWLADLLYGRIPGNIETLNKFLGSKRSTLSQLEQMLAKRGIKLYLTIRGETPPMKGAPRMQFLKNNFQKHRNPSSVIASIGGANAPQCWWDDDDIGLKELYDIEKYFGMTLQWNFVGLSDTPDTMISAPMRSTVHKAVKEEFNFGQVTGKAKDAEASQQNEPATAEQKPEPKKTFSDSKEVVEEVKEIFRDEVPWLMDILSKNKTEEDMIFNIDENQNLQRLDDVYVKKTMSTLRDYLKLFGYDFSIRIWADPKLPDPYRNQFTGFIWKWMEDEGINMEQVCSWVKNSKYDGPYGNPVEWRRDDNLPLNSLQHIANMIGLKLSVILVSLENEHATPDSNMISFIVPERRVKSLPTALAQKKVKESVEPVASAAKTTKRTITYNVKHWLEMQPAYSELWNKTPEERRCYLDGRLGENTVIALFPFNLATDIALVELHRELHAQIVQKRVTAGRTEEADLDTSMIVASNRESIMKLDCIGEIQDKLSSVPKAQEMLLDVPLMTQEGKTITGVVWTPSEGLALEGKKKGFLIRKTEKISAINGHPEILASLFDAKTWYFLAKKAREHYRLNGIQRVKETLSATKRQAEDIRSKLTSLHSMAVQQIMTIIAETQDMNLMNGFIEMIGEKMYAEPVLKEGKVYFQITADDDNSTRSVAAEEIKTENLLALCELLNEHVDKMLNL